MRAFYVAFAIVLLFGASTEGSARERPTCSPMVAKELMAANTLTCDNDKLAQCLTEVDDEFYVCEASCREEFPDAGPDYNDCRNECRDLNAEGRSQCYDDHCPRGVESCRAASDAEAATTLERYYGLYMGAEACLELALGGVTSEGLNDFKLAISAYSATLSEDAKNAAWSQASETSKEMDLDTCTVLQEVMLNFDAFDTGDLENGADGSDDVPF